MEYEIINDQNLINELKEFMNYQGGKPILIYCFKPEHERKNSCGWKPKNSASNKSRNNIRIILKPNYRAVKGKVKYYHKMEKLLKPDINELDFLN